MLRHIHHPERDIVPVMVGGGQSPLASAGRLPGVPLSVPLVIKPKVTSKQQVEHVIRGLLARLNKCQGALEARIERSKRNHGVVRAGQRQIKSEKAAGHYAEAETKLATGREHYVAQRERLYQQVLSLDQTISAILEELGLERAPKRPFVQASQQQRQASTRPAPKSPKPRRPATARSDGAERELDVLSRRAMEQHAAAVMGIDPSVFDKKRGRR